MDFLKLAKAMWKNSLFAGAWKGFSLSTLVVPYKQMTAPALTI